MLTPEEVFITVGYPRYTYVDHDKGRTEAELRKALDQKNTIISIVGESKTGKTTLCDKCLGIEKGRHKIYITGDNISDEEKFWEEVSTQIDGDIYTGRNEIIDAIVEHDTPVVIDDFHYIRPEVQKQLCRQIKNAASQGIRFIILNTRHRSDDPIRSNPDLSGRFTSIDMNFWNDEDLMQIGIKGFKELDISITNDVLERLAKESLRSPQLMQMICRETCLTLDKDVPYEDQPIDSKNFSWKKVRAEVVRSHSQDSNLCFLKNGPLIHGEKRLSYKLRDDSTGDVYEILVQAIGMDPPLVSFDLDQIKNRVAKLVSDDKGPNIRAALKQINEIFEKNNVTPPLEWDDTKRVLTIIDPHFYFYLRHSTEGFDEIDKIKSEGYLPGLEPMGS